MNFRAAIPDNPFYAPLIQHAEQVCASSEIELIKAPEHQCADMLHRHVVELALVTPEGYGGGVEQADYRIVRGPAIMLEGLTYTASLYFKDSESDLTQIVSPAHNDFLIRIGQRIFNEKFNVHSDLRQAKGESAELLHTHDAVINWGCDESLPISLDISDEWMDTTQSPLVGLFWVSRPEMMPENIETLVTAMAARDLQTSTEIVERPHNGATAERTGRIHWHWNDDSETALQKAIEMMFYFQMVKAMSAVKIWGRDPYE